MKQVTALSDKSAQNRAQACAKPKRRRESWEQNKSRGPGTDTGTHREKRRGLVERGGTVGTIEAENRLRTEGPFSPRTNANAHAQARGRAAAPPEACP